MHFYLRHALIRLLLALCLNSVIGVPAHEALHLRGIAAAAAGPSSAQAAEDADAEEHGAQSRDACAWCLASVHLFTAPASLPAVHACTASGEARVATASESFVPRAGHWRFASRDPPHRIA